MNAIFYAHSTFCQHGHHHAYATLALDEGSATLTHVDFRNHALLGHREGRFSLVRSIIDGTYRYTIGVAEQRPAVGRSARVSGSVWSGCLSAESTPISPPFPRCPMSPLSSSDLETSPSVCSKAASTSVSSASTLCAKTWGDDRAIVLHDELGFGACTLNVATPG